MPRVNAMNDEFSLEGFDAVWQRVTEREDTPDTADTAQSTAHEQAICLVRQDKSSCAVRFIPRF